MTAPSRFPGPRPSEPGSSPRRSHAPQRCSALAFESPALWETGPTPVLKPRGQEPAFKASSGPVPSESSHHLCGRAPAPRISCLRPLGVLPPPTFSPPSLGSLSGWWVYLGAPAALIPGPLPLPQIEEIFKKAGHPFMWNEHLGYVLTCPSNLGTGLRGGVHVKLAHLSKHPKFEEILTRLRLQKRGTGAAHVPSRGFQGWPLAAAEGEQGQPPGFWGSARAAPP